MIQQARSQGTGNRIQQPILPPDPAAASGSCLGSLIRARLFINTLPAICPPPLASPAIFPCPFDGNRQRAPLFHADLKAIIQQGIGGFEGACGQLGRGSTVAVMLPNGNNSSDYWTVE